MAGPPVGLGLGLARNGGPGLAPGRRAGRRMRLFSDLYVALDSTTKTSRKVDALARYFRAAAPGDAAWALFFLSGRRLKRLFPAQRLAQFAAQHGAVPDW